MNEKYTTKTAEIRGFDPHEDAEIPLFEAPFDGLIANVTYTPAEDIQGAHDTRSLHLIHHPRAGYDRKTVANLWLEAADVLLPGGERHNVRMSFPPVSLKVHDGEPLLWSSLGSVGVGLAVPAGTVEIIFERKQIADDLSPPELWAQCVPDYWIGKKVLVKHTSKGTPRPEHGPGAYSKYEWELTGTLEGADSQILKIEVDPIEHGHLPRKGGLPLRRVEQIKLLENEGPA